MINLVALFLREVATSLLSGGFFTPSPEKQPTKQDLILKEANRIIMVEYGGESLPDHIPPPSPTPPPPAKEEPSALDEKHAFERSIATGAMDKVKENGKQAASVLPNIAQGIAGTSQNFKPKEVICDALGKCKQKVAGVFSKVKEKAHGEVDDGEGVMRKAREAVEKSMTKPTKLEKQEK